MIYGKWTECLWGLDPAAYESFKKQERRTDPLRKTKLVSGSVRRPPRGWGGWEGWSLAGPAACGGHSAFVAPAAEGESQNLSLKQSCLSSDSGRGRSPPVSQLRLYPPEPGGSRGHLHFPLDTSLFLWPHCEARGI